MLRVNIEVVDSLEEDEIVIRCKKLDNTVQKVHQAIMKEISATPKLTFYKKNEAYYFLPEKVLFFETDNDCVYAHTANDVFRIRFRLYELEEMLPGQFVRISKSAIINMQHIFAIDRNLTSASLVRFQESHKQVYVSRFYYKNLREKLKERVQYEY